jgi:transcriptional regulator with XRE-family HTH domain
MRHTTGKLIRGARLASKVSQVELAKKLGISSQYIANFERGVSNPPHRLIKKISKLLEINTTLLINALVSDYKESLIRKVNEGKSKK